jgi:hypothetical protein
MPSSRLLVIGLDAADKDLIEEWAAIGDPRHLSGHGFESKTIVPKKN